MHSVEFVTDDLWSVEGHDWVMLEEQPKRWLLLIREGAVCPRVLDEAWAGFVMLAQHHCPPPVVPSQARNLPMLYRSPVRV